MECLLCKTEFTDGDGLFEIDNMKWFCESCKVDIARNNTLHPERKRMDTLVQVGNPTYKKITNESGESFIIETIEFEVVDMPFVPVAAQQSAKRTAGTWRKFLNFVGRVAGSLRRR